MPDSVDTSVTSVSDLLDAGCGKAVPPRTTTSREEELLRWASHDSLAAATEATSAAPVPRDGDDLARPSLELRLEVATSTVHEQRSRIRQLEGEVRTLHQQHADALAGREAMTAAQAATQAHAAELEAALREAQQAAQQRAAEVARLEGRAALAEGSLCTAQQQASGGAAEARAARDAALAELRSQHARQLDQLRAQHEHERTELREGLEAQAEAARAKATRLESALHKEQARCRDLQGALDREQSKRDAVKELMRHANDLEAANERLKAAAAEERRRAGKAAAALDAAVDAERHQGELAMQEVQARMQDLGREHDKALRQARAKLQRTETELRSSKHQAAEALGRAQELEALNAKKDLQLDAAVQQVTLMQHELEALRQGLSSRQAAMLETARGEFSGALDACRTELEQARRQAAEEAQRARQQGAVLTRVAAILAVHAGEEGPASSPQAEGASAREVDAGKVVAIVEAISAGWEADKAEWEAERAGLVQALESAQAVHAELEALLQQEKEEGRRATAEAAHAQGSMEAAHVALAAQAEQLKSVEAMGAARAAAERALEACRSELAVASAKAASAADEAAKWQGTASALEVAITKAQAAAEAAARKASDAQADAAAKEQRIREMRAAMANAMEEKTSSLAGQSALLAELHAACSNTAEQVAQAQALVADGGSDPHTAALAGALQAAGVALQAVPREGAAWAGCSSALARALSQLAGGYAQVAGMLEERQKVHGILTSVNGKLRGAAKAHAGRLSSVGNSSSKVLIPAAAANPAPAVPLVDLLQALAENVVGLVEGLAVEKEALESQVVQAQSEAHGLHFQLKSMASVLDSLRSDTAMEHREALVALEQAQLHVADLAQQNAELEARAAQAQAAMESVRASATQEWSVMKEDISRLVTAAEHAQLDAQAAVQRHKDEADTRVARLQAQLEDAQAGEARARAGAEEARAQLAAAQAELEAARRAAGQQAAAAGNLEAAQQQIQGLEEQVDALQRQVAATKRGISTAAAKKAATASNVATRLKKENEGLREQAAALQEEVRKLQSHMRDGVRQLQQARELGGEAQLRISEAEGRAVRAEALLQKTAERKAAAEVERKRAQEAAGRLEQQVLELQSRLEAAQTRERAAQADAERLRSAGAKREGEARQLTGAMAQLEVAEAALRDSQATASRLLQDCTNLRSGNQELTQRVQSLEGALAEAENEAAAARQQVEDLQSALDAAITELELAQAMLLQRRSQEMEALGPERADGDEQRRSPFAQDIIAFPLRVQLNQLSAASAHSHSEQAALDSFMQHVLGPHNVRTGASYPSTKPLSQLSPAARSALDRMTPLTQAPSVLAPTPGTPLMEHAGPTPAGAPHMADDASSRGPSATPQAGTAAEASARSPNENAVPQAGSRPTSAASSQQPADVSDVRQLIVTVESLQRLLEVKNQRIAELRAALTSASQGSGAAAATAPPAREAFVLQQRLDAAERQVANLKALNEQLDGRLAEAHRARQEAQAQLASARAQAAEAERGAATGADLARAQEHVASLTLQLASRNAALQALQSQLATHVGQHSRCRSACTQTSDGEAAAATLLEAPPPLVPASLAGDGSDALSSIERIVGLWKQACDAKDSQLAELHEELLKTRDALHRAEVEYDGLRHEAAALAGQQQDAAALASQLQQLLSEAEQRLVDAQAGQQALEGRVAELTAELDEAQAGRDAEAEEARAARQEAAAAEQRAKRAEQQLGLAEAQVRELQHSVQLEQLSSSSTGVLRQQLQAAQADLEEARARAAAAQQAAVSLKEQLRQAEEATTAAAEASTSVLATRLDAAQRAEQQLLREAQDCQAQLAAAQAELERRHHDGAVQAAQVAQLSERLGATERELSDAVDTIQQQNATLTELHATLTAAEERERELGAAAVCGQQAAMEAQQLRQQLAIAQQELAIAAKQADVLRAQLERADVEHKQLAADRRHLATMEARTSEALARYQRGVAVLSSALTQLQASAAAQAGDGSESLLESSRRQLVAGGTSGGSMAVEQLVDELLLHMHRKDCDCVALLAQVAHLEAALGSSARDLGEQQAAGRAQAAAVRRVKEELAWCQREVESLRRQLADRDAQIARLRGTVGSGLAATVAAPRRF